MLFIVSNLIFQYEIKFKIIKKLYKYSFLIIYLIKCYFYIFCNIGGNNLFQTFEDNTNCKYYKIIFN